MLYKVEGHTDMNRKCDGQEFRRKLIYINMICMLHFHRQQQATRSAPAEPMHAVAWAAVPNSGRCPAS